jgi:hypothetical protein
MKIHELPTYLLRDLAARCEGLNAVVGDGRVALKAVAAACHLEITRRVEGGDFPEISDGATATFSAQINSPATEFARLICEINE